MIGVLTRLCVSVSVVCRYTWVVTVLAVYMDTCIAVKQCGLSAYRYDKTHNGTIVYDAFLRYRTSKKRMDKRIFGMCTMKTIILLVRREE